MNDLKEKIEKVDSRNEMKELLNGIYNQIASFDNKAAVLISIIGIVFALSFDALDIFKSITIMLDDLKLWREFNYIMLGVYCLSFILSIIFFILVIVPRSHKSPNIHINYYKDIVQTRKINFKRFFYEYIEDDNVLINQIYINADICYKKHIFLKFGICTLISFIISMVYFIVCSTFIII